ncbi:unnamed protein product [Rhizoctonia solani]|uniref:Target of rapamycin complex 2 subunit bit61 n=1 Tax=Rhizoctonia solani TaxID=456999 RepID=A0A8H3A5G6_9AGAM|nr:unnamed protein product [Rhizoctonia solani]
MLKSRRDLPPISNPRAASPLPPRRSHDSRSDSPLPFLDSERRRSNSDGTAPTPRPAPRPLAVHVPSPVQEKSAGAGGSISSSSDPRIRPIPALQRSGTSSTGGSSLFASHSLGVSRSQGGTPRDPTAGSTTSSPMNAARSSPVKARGAYESKHIAREMDRLGVGVGSGIPSANTSTLSLPLTSQPLPSIAGGGSILNSTTSDTAPYQELHVHVLPLFNSENLKLPIEELNGLVKQHIQAVISRGPSRARAVLEQDVKDLVNMGMITLNAKLQGLEEETLLTRVVQIWGFFWDQVLPYLEGVFLPLQTEKILQNLARNTKTVRPGSPGSPAHDLPGVVPLVGCPTIDVRNVVLQSFRDSIIQPIWQKLYDQLLAMGKDVDASASLGDRSARLQQMLLVLSSASSRSILLSQSSQLSPMNPGEEAVTHLLRAILRVRALASSRGAQSHQRLPPPPALGIAHKEPAQREGMVFSDDADGDVFTASRDEIEAKERQFLDSLKSPVPQNEASPGSPENKKPTTRAIDQKLTTPSMRPYRAYKTPRDRRGRIAHKEPPQRDGMVFSDDADGDVFAPPGPRDEIEVQERQFLDSLKSPVPQSEVGPGSPENKKPTTRAPEQADTRGLGFATAMRAVI